MSDDLKPVPDVIRNFLDACINDPELFVPLVGLTRYSHGIIIDDAERKKVENKYYGSFAYSTGNRHLAALGMTGKKIKVVRRFGVDDDMEMIRYDVVDGASASGKRNTNVTTIKVVGKAVEAVKRIQPDIISLRKDIGAKHVQAFLDAFEAYQNDLIAELHKI